VQVTSSATQIAATARQQEATATEQAATTNQIKATVTQITATSKELAKTMHDVTEVAWRTSEGANSGRSALQHMETTMHQMVEASESIGSKLAVLSEKAGTINTVVTTINRVADQTNLLSLNAAIEAEKAGEYGVGFATVGSSTIARAVEQRMRACQDLVMPDVDGLTLVRFYRNNPAPRDIPVIVLSSQDDPNVKSDAFYQGATDYPVKLPEKVELLARIRAHTKSYLAQRERDEAFVTLRKLQQQLEQMNTELARSNNELQRLSALDGLTGVANRRQFDQVLEREWRRATRSETPLSLSFADIDFFKRYNDHYGHQAGDDCLKQVAAALQQTVRRPADRGTVPRQAARSQPHRSGVRTGDAWRVTDPDRRLETPTAMRVS
jgi:PleD family two-component response regulator